MDRSKLAAIATVLGVLTVGGLGVTVWQAGPDTAVADLTDAGVMDCPTRLVTCDWRIDAEGQAILAAAGVVAPTGYRTLAARVKVCTAADGSRDVVFPPMPQRAGKLAALAVPNLKGCDIDPDPGGALWRAAPSKCVRRPAGAPVAACFWAGDGGDQGELNAYPRSLLTGPGCEDTPCVVFAGDQP